MPLKRKSTDGEGRSSTKKIKKETEDVDELDSDTAARAPPTAKKPTKYTEDSEPETEAPRVQVNSSGEKFYELGKTKRVTVRQYKKSVLVDIREFYQDKETDEMKPGKKGISLSVEQYEQLKTVMSVLDELVEELK
ncbi:RNA polymerase II transcriptional coactivator [Mycena amicta]|nr:RNA polymerase II transcriptional coactivator [Mycena amicta]